MCVYSLYICPVVRWKGTRRCFFKTDFESSCFPAGSSSPADMECGGGELSDSGSSGYWSWDHGNVSPAPSPSVTEMDSSPDEGLHMEQEQGDELNAKKPKVQSCMCPLQSFRANGLAPYGVFFCLSLCTLCVSLHFLSHPLSCALPVLCSLSHRALSEACTSVCGPVAARCSRLQSE